MVLLGWFVLCLGLGLNVVFLFLEWVRLGEIHWCLIDLGKDLEKSNRDAVARLLNQPGAVDPPEALNRDNRR